MPKFSGLFSNLFLKQRTNLETDAAPIQDESPHDQQTLALSSAEVSNAFPSTLSGEHNMLQTYEPNYNTNQLAPSNSNILAVNNTQGQVVYQFAHINGLHLGSVYNINNNKESPESNEKIERQRTKTIQAMMKSEEPISIDMLDTISMHLGEGWKKVMRVLEFSEGQIHQAIVDNQYDGGIKEAIYQLLLEWSRNCDDASLGKITKILWKTGHKETVLIMKKAWKSEMKT